MSGHVLQTISLTTEHGNLIVISSKVCHQTGAEPVTTEYQDSHSSFLALVSKEDRGRGLFPTEDYLAGSVMENV